MNTNLIVQIVIGIGLVFAGFKLGQYWLAFRFLRDPVHSVTALMKYRPDIKIQFTEE